MRKKFLYFILFVIMCFCINVDTFKAVPLNHIECEYKTNWDKNNEKYIDSIWIHFERKDEKSQWEIDRYENGKQNVWYQNQTHTSPVSLNQYTVKYDQSIGDTCPTSLIMNTSSKELILSNDIAILKSETTLYDVGESEDSVLECEYETQKLNKNWVGEVFTDKYKYFRYNYYIRFTKTYNNGNKNFYYRETFVYDESKGINGETGGLAVNISDSILIKDSNILYGAMCPSAIYLNENGINTSKISANSNQLLTSKEFENGVKKCEYGTQYLVIYDKNQDQIQFASGGSYLGGQNEYDYILDNGRKYKITNDKTMYLNKIKEDDECPYVLNVDKYKVGFEDVKIYFTSTNRNQTTYVDCNSLITPESCNSNTNEYSCVWVDTKESPNGGYCSTDKLQFVACGDAYDIPGFIPGLTSFAVIFMKVITPIILIFVSVVALIKALAASNEDEIKKAQKGLVRKIIAAAMVFMVISIVQFVIAKVAANDDELGNIENCLNCFLSNNCETSIYYKTISKGETVCKYLSGESLSCPDDEEKNENSDLNNNNGS